MSVKARVQNLLRALVGVGVGVEALAMPLWARLALSAVVAIAAMEGITPALPAVRATSEAVENKGPWQ